MVEQNLMLLMHRSLWTLIIITVILLAGIIVLYILGKKLQKKQEKNQEMMQANRQQINMLVIDKKRMRLIDSGLPNSVIENTPKRYRRARMYIVKGKVGAQVMSFICDRDIYEQVPVKTEIKAGVSGLYILDIKGLRTALEKPAPKLSLWQRIKKGREEKVKQQEQEKLKQEKALKKVVTKKRQEKNRQLMKEKNKQVENDKNDITNKEKIQNRYQNIRRGNNRKKNKK